MKHLFLASLLALTACKSYEHVPITYERNGTTYRAVVEFETDDDAEPKELCDGAAPSCETGHAGRILDGAPSPFPLGSPTRYTSDGTATRYSFSIDDGDDDETPAFCEAPASLGEGRCTDGSRLVMGR